MPEHTSFFHLQNLQDDFMKYYSSTHKHRIDEVKLSRLGILYGAAILNRRIDYIFQKEETKGMVICAHMKHSKIHDIYIIATCLIYGYTLFHSNWHTDTDELLAYKLRATNCRLVIVDDEIETSSMIPEVKYLRLSDIYAKNIYTKSVSLSNSLTLVESLGKDRSDSRIQELLSSQSKLMGQIKKESVMMITFTSSVLSTRPKARKVTYGDMLGHFKELDSMGAWTPEDILVVFMANPTYDYFTCIILYYCLRRPNVHMHFLQRYMSTYWKILWEANEHAKNVYPQLGKKYKILSWLFPRQLEALLTLEEVARESLVLSTVTEQNDATPLMKKLHHTRSLIVSGSAEAESNAKELSDEKEETISREQSCSESPVVFPKREVTPEKVIGRKQTELLLGNYDKPLLPLPDTGGRSPRLIARSLTTHSPHRDIKDHLVSSLTRSISMSRAYNENIGTNYIPKLHLKFSELRNVLCDKNVFFMLSGTYASIDLCRTFANLTGGKTPFIRYGCTEISPTMTLVPVVMDRKTLFELYEMGIQHTFDGRKMNGHYVGVSVSPDLQTNVVKSVDPCDADFMVECSPGEPGRIVCNALNPTRLILPGNPRNVLLEDGTYLGIDDVGFYLTIDDVKHFYWLYKVDPTIPQGMDYPYIELLNTSRILHHAICTRYELTPPVVRVETVQVELPEGGSRIVSAVELVTAMKADIAQDMISCFRDISKSTGIFKNCVEPEEIKILSIPWAYKGTVNYAVLRELVKNK